MWKFVDLASERSALQRGEKAAKLSSFAVAVIGLAKGAVGLFSGSIALFAQAVDSLTDLFASLTVYLSLKLAQRRPTEKFPYGYYRAETFASLVVAAFILISGVEILRQSVFRFLQPEVVSFPQYALSVAVISIPILYFLAKYTRKIGEEINSQAIIGQAKNFILDTYSSMLVFVGVLSSYLGVPWIEALVGVLISVFILKTGVGLGRDAILTLMDAIVKPEYISKIRRSAEKVQGVIDVHDVKIRKSGPFYFGEMHIEIEEGLPIEKAHIITEEVVQKAKQEFKELETLTIHLEPAKREKFRIAIPIEENKGLESKIKPHFAKASNFMLVDIDQGRIKNWFVKPNPGAELIRKRGTSAANFLTTNKVNVVFAGEIGEGPFHLLRDSFVGIYKLQKDSRIVESIEDFLHGKLEKLMSLKNKS